MEETHGDENRRDGGTCSKWALQEDLFGGDHGEARAGVVPIDSVAELGPRAALDGAPGEARAREAAGAGGCGDLDLVALVVEAVLDHLQEAGRVGPEDDPRREEEVEVEVEVAFDVRELAPPELVLLLRRHRSRHGSLSLSPARRVRALGLCGCGGVRRGTGAGAALDGVGRSFYRTVKSAEHGPN